MARPRGLLRHLQSAGASRVLLTAPVKAPQNIVHGVNHEEITDADAIISDEVQPTQSHLSWPRSMKNTAYKTDTSKPFTVIPSQNLIDNFHSGDRRGRAAALNMVLTETGAAKAVAKRYLN